MANLLYFKCEYQSHTASADPTDAAASAHHGEKNSNKVGAWLRRSKRNTNASAKAVGISLVKGKAVVAANNVVDVLVI
jgi:hypothetical protein